MPHAIRVHQTGGPEVMRWEAVDLPAPRAGEVRLRHTAIGLNFVDVYHRSGLYSNPMPIGLGKEAAGVVEAVGGGVADLKAGDRVAYATGPLGAYAEERNIPAEHLVKLPEGIDDKTAAAVLLKGLTAGYLANETYAVKAGDSIVVHAAAGGVGLLLVQWAKHLGATVIGTVGSEPKAALAREHGCDHVVFYRTEDLPARVREITKGAMVPVVYDSVGKDTWTMSLDSLAPRGLMVTYGNASGPVGLIDPRVLMQKGSLYLTRPTNDTYSGTKAQREAGAARLFDLVKRGVLRVQTPQTYSLRDVARAHQDLEARKTTGSTLLLP